MNPHPALYAAAFPSPVLRDANRRLRAWTRALYAEARAEVERMSAAGELYVPTEAALDREAWSLARLMAVRPTQRGEWPAETGRAAAWQPIETAPKDRWILAAQVEHPDLQYHAYAARWHSGGYWMANCGQYVTESPEPTHWMPLPEPPEPQHA